MPIRRADPRLLVFFALFAETLLPGVTHAGVTWDQQATRLQAVSASYLDAAPVGEPLRHAAGLSVAVEAKTIVSLLPQADTTIGGKTEDVPTSPVHLLPMLQLDLLSGPVAERFQLGAQVWGAFKPAGGESLLGVDAHLSQWALGLAVVPTCALGAFDLYGSVGYQYTSATVTGAITARGSRDRLRVTTPIVWAAPGLRLRSLGVFTTVLLGRKSTDSTFRVEADQTRLEVSDTPVLGEVVAGWQAPFGLQVGAAELLVRERLYMPRLLLSYAYAFD